MTTTPTTANAQPHEIAQPQIASGLQPKAHCAPEVLSTDLFLQGGEVSF